VGVLAQAEKEKIRAEIGTKKKKVPLKVLTSFPTLRGGPGETLCKSGGKERRFKRWLVVASGLKLHGRGKRKRGVMMDLGGGKGEKQIPPPEKGRPLSEKSFSDLTKKKGRRR